jgi:hypothetical protein
MNGSVKEKVMKLVNDLKTAMTVSHEEDTVMVHIIIVIFHVYNIECNSDIYIYKERRLMCNSCVLDLSLVFILMEEGGCPSSYHRKYGNLVMCKFERS